MLNFFQNGALYICILGIFVLLFFDNLMFTFIKLTE